MKLYEDDVLEMLESDPLLDASQILSSKLPKMDRKFTNAVKKLAAVLEEVRLEFPDAMLYTASGGLVLMLGNSHNEGTGRRQQQLIAASCGHIITIGDGDF